MEVLDERATENISSDISNGLNCLKGQKGLRIRKTLSDVPNQRPRRHDLLNRSGESFQGRD